MNKQFSPDFYVTCATVVPVLFLAIAVQGQTSAGFIWGWSRLIASVDPDRPLNLRTQWRIVLAALFLGVLTVVIVIAAGIGESLAIWVLYKGSETSTSRQWVLVTTLTLVALVTLAPLFATFMKPAQVSSVQPRQAASGEDEAGGNQHGQPPQGASGNVGQPGP